MPWSNVVVEGFCFAEYVAGKYPCDKPCPSTFCLRNHICPYFAWGESTERDAASFVPLHLIIWDKTRIWFSEELIPKLRWWFWNRWHKTEWPPKGIQLREVSSDTADRWEKERKELDSKFSKWFEEAINIK